MGLSGGGHRACGARPPTPALSCARRSSPTQFPGTFLKGGRTQRLVSPPRDRQAAETRAM